VGQGPSCLMPDDEFRYELLLMSGVGRTEARDQIRHAVDRILASWS
jgi:hypothetical protein